MRRGLARRISDLERRTGKGRGAFIVVKLAYGADADAALAALRLVPGPADLVLIVRHFGEAVEPALINRCPITR